jgi:hypothetical protein
MVSDPLIPVPALFIGCDTPGWLKEELGRYFSPLSSCNALLVEKP